MFGRVRSAIILAVVLLAATASASSASAATPAWTSVDVTLLGGQQPALLVSGKLPDDVPLPYQGELSVPAGSAFLWIGEIIGTDPAKDPPLEYTKRTEGDLDVYSFTLTQSRVAQLEISASGMSASDGTNVTTQLRWKAWADLPSVTIAERMPAGSEIVQAVDDATMRPAGTAFTYYTRTAQGVKAGDAVELVFTYKPGTPVAAGSGGVGATGQPSAGASNQGQVLLITVVVALLIVTSVAFIRVSRGSAAPVTDTPASSKPKAAAAKQPTKSSEDDAFFDEDEL